MVDSLALDAQHVHAGLESGQVHHADSRSGLHDITLQVDDGCLVEYGRSGKFQHAARKASLEGTCRGARADCLGATFSGCLVALAV